VKRPQGRGRMSAARRSGRLNMNLANNSLLSI
jgi:hypothetical protein